VQPGPGDDFFADLPRDAELAPEQRQAVHDLRGLLHFLRPQFARPQDTTGSVTSYGEIDLAIAHAADPSVRIELHFGDGYLRLRWPGGEEHGGGDWDHRHVETVEALLTGHNLQTLRFRFGRLLWADLETWDEHGRRRRHHRTWKARHLPLASLVLLPQSCRPRSISFTRAPGVVDLDSKR